MSSDRRPGTHPHAPYADIATQDATHRWIAEWRESDGLVDLPQPRVIELHLSASKEERSYGD